MLEEDIIEEVIGGVTTTEDFGEDVYDKMGELGLGSVVGIFPPDVTKEKYTDWIIAAMAVEGTPDSDNYCIGHTGLEIFANGGKIVEENNLGIFAHYKVKAVPSINVFLSACMLEPGMMWRADFPFAIDKIVQIIGPRRTKTLATNTSSFMMYLYQFFLGEEYLYGGVGAALAGVGLYKATGHKLGVGGI